MKYFFIEMTDTFGDEANYTWTRYYKVRANTHRGAVNKFAKETAAGWQKEWEAGDMMRYNHQSDCVCFFIQQFNEHTHNRFNCTEI